MITIWPHLVIGWLCGAYLRLYYGNLAVAVVLKHRHIHNAAFSNKWCLAAASARLKVHSINAKLSSLTAALLMCRSKVGGVDPERVVEEGTATITTNCIAHVRQKRRLRRRAKLYR